MQSLTLSVTHLVCNIIDACSTQKCSAELRCNLFKKQSGIRQLVTFSMYSDPILNNVGSVVCKYYSSNHATRLKIKMHVALFGKT